MNKSLKSIFQNISYLSSVQLVLALTGILRNKILAVKLSEDGFGAFNQVLLFTSLLSTLICLGMNVSLTRNMAVEKSKERQQELLNNANATVFYLYLAICLPIFIISFFAPRFIFNLIHVPYTTEYQTVLYITLLFLIFDGFKNNLINVLTATLNIGKMAKGRILAVAIATAVGIPLIFYFSSIGGAIQYTMINILLYVVLFKEVKNLGFKPVTIAFNKIVFKSLFF
jgi:O-antigen/teichoic acid export membrane protein